VGRKRRRWGGRVGERLLGGKHWLGVERAGIGPVTVCAFVRGLTGSMKTLGGALRSTNRVCEVHAVRLSLRAQRHQKLVVTSTGMRGGSLPVLSRHSGVGDMRRVGRNRTDSEFREYN